jgi:group I intron endonuclease
MIIYKVTNTINNKVYIGKTTRQLNERIIGHYDSAKYSNSQTNFHRALMKYPKDVFVWEELDTAKTDEELNELEKHYIEKFNSFNFGYNMSLGGTGGLTYKKGDLMYEQIKHKLGKWKDGNPGATDSAIEKRKKTFINTNWKSGNLHGNYGKQRLDMLDKAPHNGNPVVICGVEYETTGKAAKSFGLNSSDIVSYRCKSKSKKWIDWKYKI